VADIAKPVVKVIIRYRTRFPDRFATLFAVALAPGTFPWIISGSQGAFNLQRFTYREFTAYVQTVRWRFAVKTEIEKLGSENHFGQLLPVINHLLRKMVL